MNRTQYFTECSTMEEVKALYRRLAMQNHPDRGGDTWTMAEINRQYQEALSECHGQTSVGSDGKEHVYRYNREVETAIMDQISALCGLGMVGVEILLIGSWVWVSGDTKPYKDQLKALKCRWHGRRRCWYWHLPQRYRSRQHKGSLADIAAAYGCDEFESEERKAVAG